MKLHIVTYHPSTNLLDSSFFIQTVEEGGLVEVMAQTVLNHESLQVNVVLKSIEEYDFKRGTPFDMALEEKSIYVPGWPYFEKDLRCYVAERIAREKQKVRDKIRAEIARDMKVEYEIKLKEAFRRFINDSKHIMGIKE